MSEHERQQDSAADSAEAIEDLEVRDEEASDVSGGGKVSVQDLSITKTTDKSTP